MVTVIMMRIMVVASMAIRVVVRDVSCADRFVSSFDMASSRLVMLFSMVETLSISSEISGAVGGL